MKIEEAIEIIEYSRAFNEGNTPLMVALDTVINAVRSMPETGKYHFREVTKMVPLTLEQLRKMHVTPVWIEDKEYPENTGWEIWDNSFKQIWLGDLKIQNSYGKAWLAYSYPPVHIDRSKWGSCKLCSLPDGRPAYRLILAETCGGEARFCPECGRPLTNEAWAELERRVTE